jgi:hypothetical protein
MTAAEVNEALAASVPVRAGEQCQPITDAQLEEMRELWRSLATRWKQLAQGDTLEVLFPARAAA